MKRILSLLLCLAMLMMSPAVVSAEGIQQCTDYEGSNQNAQNQTSYYARVIDSYLAKTADGNLMRFQSDVCENQYLVEYYNSAYELLSVKKIDAELPVFGGFYASESNYYVLSGQINSEESDAVEVFRVTKYDLSWNRISAASLFGANTYIPFDAGSARFAESGNYLFVRTSHEMYMSDDGYHHQANVTIQIDTSTMTVTDSYTDVMNSGYGYVSHSFNQFIHVEDNNIVAVDHGDAYPRSIVLIKYTTDITDGTFVPTYNTRCTVTNLLTFPGTIGQNYTGASVGGFEISDTSYLVAYNSVAHDDNYTSNKTRNIFVSVMNKTDSSVVNKQITAYSEQGTAVTETPHLVKLSSNEFMLLWNEGARLCYATLDGEGNLTSEITVEADAYLSDCVPVVYGDKLVWYVYNDNVNTFYEISLSDLSLYKTVIDNSHVFEVSSYPETLGGDCTLQCEKCEQTKTFATGTGMKVWWNTDGGNTYYSYRPSKFNVGDKLYAWIIDDSNDCNTEKTVTVFGDDGGVVCTETYSDHVFSFEKDGIYRITVAYKYAPDVKFEFRVTVGDVKLGDVDGNGKIEAIDYLLLKRAWFGSHKLTPAAQNRSDIDINGSVEPTDYLLLKRAYFGTYTIE